MLIKGLNSSTLTTEFRFHMSESCKGSFIHSIPAFRDEGKSTDKALLSATISQGRIQQPPSESGLDLLKLVQICPKMVNLNLSQLKVY